MHRYKFFLIILFIYFNKYCVGQPDDKDLLNCIIFILRKYFKGNCLCFINLLDNFNEFELNLMKILYKIHSFYLLSSVNDTLKHIPYPCFYFSLSNDFERFHSINSKNPIRFFLNNETLTSKHLIVYKSNLNEYEIYKSLVKLFNYGYADATAIYFDSVIKAYTIFPFGKNLRNCPENGILFENIDVWFNNSFSNDLFPEKIPKIFAGCYLNVSFTEYIPYTIVRGSLVRGIEGYVMSLVGKTLNMSINWVQRKHVFSIDNNGTKTGTFPDILYGRSQIACGGLVNLYMTYRFAQSTKSYAICYLQWYTPFPPFEPIWQTLYKAFAPILMILSICTVLIAPMFIVFIAKKIKNESNSFKKLINCYLTTWAVAIGNTTGIKPKTIMLRILYTAWIFCTFHLALAYTASLTGLIAKNAHRPRIQSFQHLKSIGFYTGMQNISYSTTSEITDTNIRAILNKHIIIDNPDKAIKLITEYKNMSLLDNNFYVDFRICRKHRKPLLYNTGLKAIAMPNGLIMRKNHYLYNNINNIITRIVESGINQNIIKRINKCMKRIKNSKYGKFKATKLKGLTGVFIILIIGLFIALIAFSIELYVYRKIINKHKHNDIIVIKHYSK
ncbi:hypothetical protein O3M35_006458 [Rhynocoris fuscipes]|uniref:Ionotropic glutamate receptor C-terminal domain-containing protein n=1 Tax=Rhynocoris fuscipes TaxID=488301 RepID=A0AAW1DED3_9HEMI